jgi:hypothetical protein
MAERSDACGVAPDEFSMQCPFQGAIKNGEGRRSADCNCPSVLNRALAADRDIWGQIFGVRVKTIRADADPKRFFEFLL